MSKDKRKITRKRFCKLLAAKIGSQVPEVRDFAACCVGFEQYKNQQLREVRDR